ncbi:MAG: molybdopterin biosynthesis protein MoeY [Azonexaceae bacterium]|nr:molybdopterin biosynthesis protein MoeY [Azonexaceae bacterium]
MAGRSSKLSRETLLRVLDRARWAPSGDNTQPWRFQIIADDKLIVHGHDTRDEILYDFDGHASHMAHGALLETIRIAASAEGLVMEWYAESDIEWRQIKYMVQFVEAPEFSPDPLHLCIETRTVQRRPMRLTPLSVAQRQALLDAPGDGYLVQLFESFSDRKKIAELLWDSAYIRLTCPEAFQVHQSIIEWGARFSKDRIPEEAVGVDRLTAVLMRWVMQSWGRVEFFNRYLLGTFSPRIQLDYLPALFCAAHLLIRPKVPPVCLEDWVNLGAAMQRVWLTATQKEMYLQPEMTPVIFRWYAQTGCQFSSNPRFAERASALSKNFECIVNAIETSPFGFFGRVGISVAPISRSIRLELEQLMC